MEDFSEDENTKRNRASEAFMISLSASIIVVS